MELNCPNCGELNVDTKFCINCGRKLKEEDQNKRSNADFTSDFSDREEKISPSTPSYENNVRPQSPAQIIGNDEKFCIVCGQTIKNSASSCKYCGATVEPVKNKVKWKHQGIILREEGKGLGVQSLVMGIMGIIFCHMIFGTLAIIEGYRALKYESEKSFGKAGIVIGVIDIIVALLIFILNNIH